MTMHNTLWVPDFSPDYYRKLIDGTLSPELQAQLEAHCRGCEACGDLLNDLREIRAAAAALDRYRRFRHVVRNVYAFDLDPEPVQQLTANLRAVFNQVSAAL